MSIQMNKTAYEQLIREDVFLNENKDGMHEFYNKTLEDEQ